MLPGPVARQALASALLLLLAAPAFVGTAQAQAGPVSIAPDADGDGILDASESALCGDPALASAVSGPAVPGSCASSSDYVPDPVPAGVSEAVADAIAQLQAAQAELMAKQAAAVDDAQGKADGAVDGAQEDVAAQSSWVDFWGNPVVDEAQAELQAKVDYTQALIGALGGTAGEGEGTGEGAGYLVDLAEDAVAAAAQDPTDPGAAVGDAVDGADGHDHDASGGYVEGTTETEGGNPYFDYDPENDTGKQPLDLDDDPAHRSRFSLDQNWALTGATLTAYASSWPLSGQTYVQWAYDQTVLYGPGSYAGVELTRRIDEPGDRPVHAITFRPTAPGLHHLTLTTKWTEGGTEFTDRVTSPIYVEDPAITLVPAADEVAAWEPQIVEAVAQALDGDPSGALAVADETAEDVLEVLDERPTVMLLSDFLGDYDMGQLAIAPDSVPALLAGLGLAGVVPEAGFGAVGYTESTTGLGFPITHVGLTLTQTLVETGLADVVFVSILDPATGSLDRTVLRNALLFAEATGIVDAVLWGLPASVYQPAVVSNSMRPDFQAAQTPLRSLGPYDALPAAQDSWQGASLTGIKPVDSVMGSLEEIATLLDLDTGGAGNFIELLHQNMDKVYPRYRPLVEAVHNDLSFDAFLQQQVLDLGQEGIAFVAPSEQCTGLESEYMTVIGITHVVGTVTVADGTADGPALDACKGPDRRAAAHGNGIDLVADPRPDRTSLFDVAAGAGVPLDAVGPTLDAEGVPYVPNSLGAALRTAQALAELRQAQHTPATPWSAQELVGMLASQADDVADLSTWAQGVGFVDVDDLDTSLPPSFARGTGVVFTPYDLEDGRSLGVAQVVVTGAGNVAAWKSAPEDSWSASGGTEFRLTTDEQGNKVFQDLSGTDFGHLEVELVSVSFQEIAPAVGMATVTLSAIPAPVDSAPDGTGASAPKAGPTGPADDTGVGPVDELDPPREWLLPGLYSGRTWISTPNGILQLPINIGVGTIFDVYRFLAPNTPVPETAVCLGPPFEAIGDLTGLRRTAMELEHLNICIYWTNTDDEGVARFYTPLPLLYTLKSWFEGHFVERGDAIGTNYPHVKRTVLIPSPLNLEGIGEFIGGLPGSAIPTVDTTPDDPGKPVFVDLELPYPLAYVPLRLEIPVAIAVHWRYLDNMETDHFLPMPDMALPEFIDLLLGGVLPDPVLRRTGEALVLARSEAEGVLNTGAEHLGPALGTTQDRVKGAVPVSSTTLDALLGQPISKALPTSLQPDPTACQFGYGHLLSPALDEGVEEAIQAPDHGGMTPSEAAAQAKAEIGDEAWWPSALTMRARPTLDHLLGLNTNLPFCTATYPFNLPQPNTYPTFITHEFDVHLEATLMIVCVETAMEVQCFLLIPGPAGTGNTVIAFSPGDLVDAGTALLTDGPDRLLGIVEDGVGSATELVDDLPEAVARLPENLDLAADGRVSLEFQVNGGDGNHGYLHYVAIPLPLLASGFLDPLVGILTEAGVDPVNLLNNVQIEEPAGLPDLDPALASVADLLRDSTEDLLKVTPYVEVSRASFFLNAWWWDDTFVHMPANPTKALPRVTRASCEAWWDTTKDPGDVPVCIPNANGEEVIISASAETASGPFGFADAYWWVTRPNINMQLFERGRSLWDDDVLRPDPAQMEAADYPWAQPEFFENVLQFWDDDTVTDNVPHEMHIHSATHVHDQVESGNVCTDEPRRDLRSGNPLNNAAGQDCITPFDFQEGDSWLHHDDIWGNGIYDPDMGTSGVPIIYLKLIDDLGAAVSGVNDLVWGTTVGTAPFSGASLGSYSEENLGVNPGDLDWWKREDGPTANRIVYSDLYTNSSYFLTRHHQTCEEMNQFTVNAIPFENLDLHPRWKVDCPWVPAGPPGANPFVAEANGVPAHWKWKRGVPDLSAPTLKDPLGNEVGNHYSHILQPVWHNGTFAIDWPAWNACKANPAGSTAPCTADHPMQQAALDNPVLAEALSVKGKSISTLDWFGMDWDGWDKLEQHVSVPLPGNPDGWYGPLNDTTEWDAFYRNKVLREWDADFGAPLPQVTDHSRFQDRITERAPLLRGWLAASPFWDDVTGQDVPYDAIARLRPTTDPDEPALLPPATPGGPPQKACDGWFWNKRCHNRFLDLDVGDLSAFGRAHYWDRVAKPQTGYFPQGLTMARWNLNHFVPVLDGNGDKVLDPADPKGISYKVEKLKGTTDWREGCWFDPGHTPAGAFHHEFQVGDITMWNDPHNAYVYHHEEPGADPEPVPGVFVGAWCVDPDGDPVPKRSVREYLDQRLNKGVNGGNRGTLLAPVTAYAGGGGTPADVIALETGSQLLPALVDALLRDAVDIADGLVPGLPTLGVGQKLDDALDAVEETEVGQAALDLFDALPALDQETLDIGDASLVVPLAIVTVEPDVSVPELLVVQSFSFPIGTQGAFMASQDDGLTWSLLPTRGAPGLIDGSGGEANLAFIDAAAFTGGSFTLGAQMLGEGWQDATWTVHRLVPLAAGSGGATAASGASSAQSAWDLVYTAGNVPADIASLAPGSDVLLAAPLAIPAGSPPLTFTGIDLVAGDCGGSACSIDVAGSLTLDGSTLTPQLATLAIPVRITGDLWARDCDLRGLLAGLMVLGGKVTVENCWMVDTGLVGVTSVLGELEVTDSVFGGQALGVYALGSRVRIEGNLFAHQARTAGLFDDSWGAVRDNTVLHTKVAGFLVKGPLGAADMAFLGNRIEETGIGIGEHLALEDRILALDPLDLGVPVPSRDRLQGNWHEWNTLEAMSAGPLSAPVAYGNDVTHSNIGVLVGWLDTPTLSKNDLYSHVDSWVEAQKRGAPPEDGNLWTGLWQLLGLTLAADASGNHWGPGPIEPGRLWPSDVVLHNAQVDLSSPSPTPTSAPFAVVLTAPGYAGGVLPELGEIVGGLPLPLEPGDALAPVTESDLVGTIVDPDLLAGLPLDRAEILGFTNRNVTVTFEVAPGVTHFQVAGQFYGSGLPDLDGVTDVQQLIDQLDDLIPGLLAPPQPVGVPEVVDVLVPVGETHGSFTFTFDGISQAYVDWNVTGYGEGESWTPAAAADATAFKTVRIHNSVTWPLLTDLAFLANGLAVDLVDDALEVVPAVLQGQALPADLGALADSGLPLSPMVDGTIAIDAVPSLLTLARDQDPVRWYEFRYRLSSAPDVALPLSTGLGADRAFALPELAEGVTLTLEGRAVDASGLASPWTGFRVLRDAQAPELELASACLSSAGAGIVYAASDPVPEGTGTRAGGVGPITLRATPVTDPLTHYDHVDDTATGAEHEGVWTLPPEAYADGNVFVIRGVVQDRAGHASATETTAAVDLSAPGILVNPQLATLKSMVDAGDPWLGSLELTADLLLTPPAYTLPMTVTAQDATGSCGLQSLDLNVRTDGGAWVNRKHWEAPEGALVSPPQADTLDLAPLDGHTFAVQVVAVDKAGFTQTFETGDVLVDLRKPTLAIDPPLPPCLSGNSAPFEWRVVEVVPQGGVTGSNLAAAALEARKNGVAIGTDGPAGSIAGDPQYVDTYQLVANGHGVYSVLVTGSDRAENADQLLQATIKVDLDAPLVSPGSLLAALVGDTWIGLDQAPGQVLTVAASVTDAINTTCGLLDAVLEMKVDDGLWQAIHDPANPSSPQALSYPVGLSTLQGAALGFRVRASDVAGHAVTWPPTPMGAVLVDTVKPFFVTPPDVPSAIGLAGIVPDWVSEDTTGDVVAEGWVLKQGETVVASGGPGDPLDLDNALSGQSFTFVATLTDQAGNSETWTKANVLFDAAVPEMDSITGAYLAPAASLVKVDWTASDAVGSIAGYDVDVLSRALDGTVTEFSVEPSPTGGASGTSTGAASVLGTYVSFRVTPTDTAGNVGDPLTSAEVFVDLTPPTITTTGPSVLGKALFGANEIGWPGTGQVSLGSGLGGATVLSPSQKPASMPFSIAASHPNSDVQLTVEALLNNEPLSGLSSSAPGSWSLAYNSGAAPSDSAQVLTLRVTGTNGLTDQDSFTFYFPQEATVAQADESSQGWTLNGAAWDTSKKMAGARSLLVDAPGVTKQPTFDTAIPSPRLVVETWVQLASKSSSGRFDVLQVKEGNDVRGALYMKNSARTLYAQTATGEVSTGVTMPLSSTAWTQVRMVLTPASFDVYLGNRYLGSYASPTVADEGAVKVVLGGIGGKAWFDSVQLRTLKTGITAIQSNMPIRDTVGWTNSGGTMSAASETGLGVTLMLDTSAVTDHMSTIALNPGALTHAVVNFKVSDAGTKTEMARLVAAPKAGETVGKTIASAYTQSGSLWLTNGYQADGTTPALPIKFTAPIASGTWHRLDLYVQGPAYSAVLDQGSQVLVGKTFVSDSAQKMQAGFGLGNVQVDRLRFQADEGQADQIFTGGALSNGWQEVDPSGSVSVSTASGHLDPGYLNLVGSAASGATSYGYAPKDKLGTKYSIEASVRPWTMSALPDHQAAIAALGSDGLAKWAVTVAPGAVSGTWLLQLRAPDGSVTDVSPLFTAAQWHQVTLVVDEVAKTFTVWVDDGAPTTKAVTVAMPATVSIAAGDVYGGTASPTGSGQVNVDDVALFPLS